MKPGVLNICTSLKAPSVPRLDLPVKRTKCHRQALIRDERVPMAY